MVNIVTIEEDRYLVEVGFGGNGPIKPIKLDQSGTVYEHITPASFRLQWRNIVVNTNQDQRLWVYEFKKDEESDFEQTYSFTELEFHPSDFNVMSYYTSNSPDSWFTQKVVCQKLLLGNDGSQLVGSVSIFGDNTKKRVLGNVEHEETLKSENDRVKALETEFGIVLNQVERESIRGLPSEIKSP
jgi:arylamine N-acetyltransferase